MTGSPESIRRLWILRSTRIADRFLPRLVVSVGQPSFDRAYGSE